MSSHSQSESIEVRIFAFFCLAIIFSITFCRATYAMTKFKWFIEEARIAKRFYISVFVFCLARTVCFSFVTRSLVQIYDRDARAHALAKNKTAPVHEAVKSQLNA